MLLNCQDTIAAIGTPPGGALRGLIRISGPETVACLTQSFAARDDSFDWKSSTTAQRIEGTIHPELRIECALHLWPTERSYTRQPSAEIHTFGSPPLLEAILSDLCQNGARLAEPGEFTLRAFLAGRIDLTQAEAVLGVIDARGEQDFGAALEQLAGGLSKPLTAIREILLALLAELEAGLDFVEEDIEFITQAQLRTQLTEAQREIHAVREQMNVRNVANSLPRVVLTGLPNAGKSSLFNAMVQRYGREQSKSEALISAQPGTTRDYLAATLDIEGLACELVDTAGIDESVTAGSIDQAAQQLMSTQQAQADLELRCVDATAPLPIEPLTEKGVLQVRTKVDLLAALQSGGLSCSSKTGHGLDALAESIFAELSNASQGASTVVYPTALRCAESLSAAEASVAEALMLAESQSGEELIAAEVRAALQQIGQVVGVVYTDDILDRIFGQFCIGK